MVVLEIMKSSYEKDNALLYKNYLNVYNKIAMKQYISMRYN
jgi:hypothetical protein